jgi:hypothetical protein
MPDLDHSAMTGPDNNDTDDNDDDGDGTRNARRHFHGITRRGKVCGCHVNFVT